MWLWTFPDAEVTRLDNATTFSRTPMSHRAGAASILSGAAGPPGSGEPNILPKPRQLTGQIHHVQTIE